MECMTCATKVGKLPPFLTILLQIIRSLEQNHKKKLLEKLSSFYVKQVNPANVLPNRKVIVELLCLQGRVFFVERCNGLSRIWKACRFLENEEQLRLFKVKN